MRCEQGLRAVGLCSSIMALSWLLLLLLCSTALRSADASVISDSRFIPCSNNSIMTINQFTYTLDTDQSLLSISLSGQSSQDVMGYEDKVDGQVQVVVNTFDGVENIIRLGAPCDMFGGCPEGVGPAIKQGSWNLKKESIHLPYPVPWIDYNITFRMPYEIGRGNYACAIIPITQVDVPYMAIPGNLAAVLPPLALLTGLMDSVLNSNFNILTFMMGDGSRYRVPGFFDLWEHSQWVVMTGMLGARYPEMYERFIGAFNWSFFNWDIGFINSLAGPSSAQPGQLPAATSSAVRIANIADASKSPGAASPGQGQQATAAAAAANDPTSILSPAGSGVTAYANAIGIGSDRLVQVTFYTYVFAMLILLVLGGLSLLGFMLLRRHRGVTAKRWPKTEDALNALVGIALRVTLLAFLPLLLTALYHIALPSPTSYGAGSVIIAVLLLMAFTGGPVYLLHIVFVQHSPTALFDSSELLLRLGPIYNTYVAGRVRYAMVPIARRIIYSLVIGAGQRSGLAQVICLVLMEVSSVLIEMWLVPRSDAFGNLLATGAVMVRTLGWILTIPLLQDVPLSDGRRQAVGFAFILFHLLLLLLWLALIIHSAVRVLIHFRNNSAQNVHSPVTGRETVLTRRRQAADDRSDTPNSNTVGAALAGTANKPFDTEFLYTIDASDNFDRYQAPQSRYSTAPRLSVVSGTFGGSEASDPYDSSTGQSGYQHVHPHQHHGTAGGAAVGASMRHHRHDSQDLSVDSAPSPALADRQHLDADFLRTGTPNTHDRLMLPPPRTLPHDTTGGSPSLASYADSGTPTGTLEFDGIYGSGDVTPVSGAAHPSSPIVPVDDLFYYGADPDDSVDDLAGSNSVPSAHQPRLMPAFLRHHQDTGDHSGDELGSPGQATFPRYMRRGEGGGRF